MKEREKLNEEEAYSVDDIEDNISITESSTDEINENKKNINSLSNTSMNGIFLKNIIYIIILLLNI